MFHWQTKKAILSALQSQLKEQKKKLNKSYLGSNMEILFEKKGRYQNQYIGRSIYNQSVFTKNNKNLINTIKKVKILNSTDFSLESSI
jgi:tRNA-2-methylthio-N6-dimethylallyladenosine synthase